MYPYRTNGYGASASSRSYQQQAPRGSSQAFEDDLPMYVPREDALQPRYAAAMDRYPAHYYAGAGVGRYEESALRQASQRYYDEGPKRIRTSYQEAYPDPRSLRGYQAPVAASVYPQRPGEQKCSFYMRTGKCSYGHDCKFDHPAWVPPEGIPGWKEEEGEFPQRPGQPQCAYFLKNGTCKFGSTCKFDHPGGGKYRAGAPAPVERGGPQSDIFGTTAPLNAKGLPLRPSEPLCQYFKKTGDCKYGGLCKFDHPDPGSAKRKRSADADDLQDVPLYLVLPGSSYPSSGAPPTRSTAYPQRPGQPECAFYMRTGTCQYGPTCKYHHPISRKGGEVVKPKTATTSKTAPPTALTPAGLPRRPGATLCAYYMKTGLCKYAPDCKFDHPPPGEAAKMAYRAAAAEKSAPAVENSGGAAVTTAQKEPEKAPERTVAENGAGAEAQLEVKGGAEAGTDEATGGNGNAVQQQEAVGGEGFEAEPWSPEAAVETGPEEGADVVEGAVEQSPVTEQLGELPETEDAFGGAVDQAQAEDAAAVAAAGRMEPVPETNVPESEIEQGVEVSQQEVHRGEENDEEEELDYGDAEGFLDEEGDDGNGGVAEEILAEGDEMSGGAGFDMNSEPAGNMDQAE